jgi:hypothetical protein
VKKSLVRWVEVASVHAYVGTRVDHPRGAKWEVKASSWLNIRGVADEPVAGVSDVEFSIRAEETAITVQSDVPCVGVVVNLRPILTLVVGLPQQDFDRAWMLVASNQLKHARVAFTASRLRTAFVKSLSLSNLPIE